jgi:hypothetical protein
MDMQHGHAAWMQHGHAAWTWSMDVQQGELDMQLGHGHAACTSTCSVDMAMQHRQVYAAWT